MGVSELWSLLKSVGNVQSISGSEGAHTAIVQELQGRAVAVDLSGWVVQATCQPDLAQAFNDPDSQALSVSFNRAVNHLRYECVPVAITEGRAPAEKLERLQQRFKARTGLDGGGRGNQYFTAMGTAVAGMLDSLGLPVVQAPGEGEAMCAALNAAGLVHACATCDGDVLLFGAQTTFHTLKLQSSDPQNSEIAKVELAWVQQMLGIGAGGANALIALSLLSGGDYAVKGAQQVGARSAVRLVQHLLQGSQDDHEVLDQLMDLVSYPPDPAMEALSAQGCTGCKLCKHPGNRKSSIAKHSQRNPCRCCPPDFVSEHHTCQPRPDVPCQCDFHTKETLRLIDKAVRRIQATANFRRKAADAAAAYHRQRQQATAAVELVRCRYSLAAGQAFQWMHRPNVQQAAQHLSFWSEEVVRGKLMPLLMQWDMCHPRAAECEWVAKAINKVHVQKAAKEEDCWRYIMHWHRLPDVNPEMVEADNAWLKRSESHHRAIKMSLVQQHCPHLIRQFEQQQKDKADKKNGVSKKTAASKAALGTASITSFYSQQKKPTSMTALPTKGIPDVSEQPGGVKPPRGLAAAMGGSAASLGPRGGGGDPEDSPGGASLAPKRGGPRGGDPGAILGGGARKPQPKHGNLRSMFACQSADDSGHSVGNTVLDQPGLDCSVQSKPRAQLPAGTSSGDPQMSHRDVEEDLLLHSPYAMHLRQKQGGQAAQRSQVCTSSSSAACYGDRDTDHVAGFSRQLDHYSTVDHAGNRPRPQQHQDQQVPEQYGHRPCEGQFDPSSRAGRLPRSPEAVTPRGELLPSPERGITIFGEDGPSTIMSGSGSEGDLEISLLSPSPAKRRKTPPSSPHPHPHPGRLSGVSEDEHHLCLAGPATSSCFPEEAQPSPRGCYQHNSVGQAANRKDIFTQTGSCKDGKHEEEEVLNCISPESGQDEGTPLQPAGTSPVSNVLQHAQHSRAAGQRWRSELCNGSGTAAEGEVGTRLRAGEQAVDARQQAAYCRGEGQSAGVPDLEVPRQRQVSRRGRGRAVQGAPCCRAPGVPVTLDSGRFGFVKLPSPRAGPSEVMQSQQLLTVKADSKACPPGREASGDNVFVLSQPTKAASKQAAGHDLAALGSISTAARVDLQLAITPSGSPVGVVESSLHQGGQQNDEQQRGLNVSQERQRNVRGQDDGHVDSRMGTVSPSHDVTPVHQRCAIRLQSMLSVDASPIDLLTPSTGAVSTIATPTFSESSEVCDLTQD